MTLKTGDFVELDYTGKVQETGQVFDTTDPEIAKANELEDKGSYKPAVICLGQFQILRGLDEQIIGKDMGKYVISLSPDKAFGKKNAKLIQLVSTSKFKKQGIQPMPGLQINIDGHIGTVKTVSGGRTIVDFNHPLSGKEVEYEVNLKRKIMDLREQIQTFLGDSFPDSKVEVQDKKVTVTVKQDVPKQLQDELIKKLKQLTDAESITFQKNNNSRVINKKV